METPPVIAKAQVRLARELISLSQEYQQLSANVERVLENYRKEVYEENDPTTFSETAFIETVRDELQTRLLESKTVIKRLAKRAKRFF